MVKIRVKRAEIFLIWTNVANTNVAWTNVTMTVGGGGVVVQAKFRVQL